MSALRGYCFNDSPMWMGCGTGQGKEDKGCFFCNTHDTINQRPKAIHTKQIETLKYENKRASTVKPSPSVPTADQATLINEAGTQTKNKRLTVIDFPV